MAATWCIKKCRRGQNDLLKFKQGIRTEKKGDLSKFGCGMIVGARRIDLSISESVDLLGFSHTDISRGYGEYPKKEKIHWAAVLWKKISYWCQMSYKNGQTASGW